MPETWRKRYVAAKGTIVNADEGSSWDALHAQYEMRRINHEEAYSMDGACTNWAEEFFSRMRRAEQGHHHHISGPYLLRYAQEASWREDHRRLSNGNQVHAVAGLAMHKKNSPDFVGYNATLKHDILKIDGRGGTRASINQLKHALERSEGKIHPTELARRILRPRSTENEIKGYREAVLKAPDISDVYEHYRGENLPADETFFRNIIINTLHIPQADYEDFKKIFYESLEKAQLLQKHGDKTRVFDVSAEIPNPEEKSARIKKLGAEVAIRAGETCFVMQPFSLDYYEKIFKPAIEKIGLQSVRADAEIGTGKIIDQVWRGINAAKLLVAELSTRNANVFYELGLAHALNKPVVLISSNEPDVPFDLRYLLRCKRSLLPS